jgi:hypothetical protein
MYHRVRLVADMRVVAMSGRPCLTVGPVFFLTFLPRARIEAVHHRKIGQRLRTVSRWSELSEDVLISNVG